MFNMSLNTDLHGRALNLNAFSRKAAVKFGWSSISPPLQFQISLNKNDLYSLDLLQPTDALVEKLVGLLQRDAQSLDKPGFVVLTNTLPLFNQDPTRVRQFQKNLSDRVFEKLFPQQQYTLTKDEMDTYKDSAKWALSENKSHQFFNASTTWQFPPHFDFYGPVPSMVSMAYGPFEGFSQGGFKIVDYRAGEQALGYPVRQGNDLAPPSLGLKKIEQHHSMSFNHLDFKTDMPIVLINNHYQGFGVAHTGLQPYPDKPGSEIYRPLNRIWYLRDAKQG